MTFDPPLLAFGFGNLAMLGWLAAAAAPLVIHLWNRRQYREMPWAAVEFLLAAMRKNARRIQFEQWLLLAVRTLIIMLVVLAVAEPFFEQMGLKFISGERTHKVLVIDGSYSMAYRPTDSSRFTRAKDLAAQIVGESSQGDGFTLVLMSDPPRKVVGTPAFEPGDFIEEIDSLKQPHTGGDLPQTLGLVKEILDHAQRESPALAQHEVYFLSDLGRTSWSREMRSPAAQAAFEKQVQELAQRAALVVLDLGQAGSENLAVTELETNESFVTTGRDITIEAQIRNFGSQPRSRHLVELLVDDARVRDEYLDIGGGGRETIHFTHRFESPGHHVVQVRLGADLLDVDNQRWLSLPVKPYIRVLCVSGKSGSTYYLAKALDPDASDRSLVRPQVVSESALMEMDLGEFDCIFLCNVGQFTSGEARLLESYLKQGGGLVFFLGDRVLAERYNRELGGEKEVRVLPALLHQVVAEAQYHFDPLDYQHPLVRVFRDQERAGLLSTPVSRYFKLEIPEAWKESRVALAFEGGDPAIVESSIARGKSIVVATAASLASVDPATQTPWTTMAAWPSFLPIVQELLSMATSAGIEPYNAQVGDTLGSAIPPAAASASVVVELPDGREQPVRTQVELGDTRWTLAMTDESGIYQAHYGPPLGRIDPFAVNVRMDPDRPESDLSKIDSDELSAGFEVKTEWQNLDDDTRGQITSRSSIHKMLLYCALGLLFVESYLAWRFGRGGA